MDPFLARWICKGVLASAEAKGILGASQWEPGMLSSSRERVNMDIPTGEDPIPSLWREFSGIVLPPSSSSPHLPLDAPPEDFSP